MSLLVVKWIVLVFCFLKEYEHIKVAIQAAAEEAFGQIGRENTTSKNIWCTEETDVKEK